MREQTKRTEIYKRALFLAVPMMIQNGITNMVGLVDNVMVGKLGTESMTAVSIVGQRSLCLTFNIRRNIRSGYLWSAILRTKK